MSNYDQIQYRSGSEPRRRRMSRYSDQPAAEPQTPEQPETAEPAQTRRVPRVYDSFQETDPVTSRSSNDRLLEQRSRAFEKQAQDTGVYTRMTQTGYHQTIRQPQRPSYDARPEEHNGAYEEYEAPEAAPVERPAYQRPSGRTNQRPQPTAAPPIPPRERYGEEPEADDEGQERFPLFARIILIVVLVLILLIAGLYFLLPEGNSGVIGALNNVKSGIEGGVTRLTGLIRPTEQPAQVNAFTCVTPNVNVGEKCVFNMTTTQNVTSVALCDADGNRIASSITKALPEGDSMRIWELSVIFEKPYNGDVFASIQQGDNVWITSDKYYTIAINYPKPTEAPAVIVQNLDPEDLETPAPAAPVTETPQPEATPVFAFPTAYVLNTAAPDQGEPDQGPEDPEAGTVPADTEAAGRQDAEPEPTETAAPTATPAPTPTEKPTPTPAPTPTPKPTFTPMPALTASSDMSKVAMTDTVLINVKTQKDYTRAEPLMAQNPGLYTFGENGVLTFRGDNFRRNAAFGTAEIADDRMTILWKKDLGSLSTADSGVLYGVGWPGQPVIVKWASDVRKIMNINEAKKNVSALREVIFSAQDGKVYFLDLTDGEETRAPINIGYPLRSSVSVNSRGYPMLSFGQSISKLKNKSGKIGYYLYNLVDQTELLFINGRQQDDKQKQYWTNGAFDGTDLTLWNNDALILAGENGLLYTVDLRTSFNLSGELTVDPTIVYQMSKSKNEPESRVGFESSIAMYNQYVYLADNYGIVRCVDTTSMKTVWAVDTGDNTDAAIALDFDDKGRLWLYTGNTNSYRLGSKKDVSIRRLNAMTGEEDWSYQVTCKRDTTTEMSGCKASPIIGQNAISHLVIFTVNMLRDGGSKIVALNKSTGEVAWEYTMSANAISSPVAVYNSVGDPWVIQGDQDGTLHLLDGRSGAHLSELKLDGRIDGSPAVYKNTLVIGTCSKGGAYMYGINLE